MRRVANQRFLTAMLDMGFRKDHAELALAETGNVGVEVHALKVRPGATPIEQTASITFSHSNGGFCCVHGGTAGWPDRLLDAGWHAHFTCGMI